MRAAAGGALDSLPLVTVIPLATSWLQSVVNSVGATGGGCAVYATVLEGAVKVDGNESRPETRLITSATVVPANFGPPPSGAVGSPTGRNRMLSESNPEAPTHASGEAVATTESGFK